MKRRSLTRAAVSGEMPLDSFPTTMTEGADAPQSEAEKLHEAVSAAFPEVEVTLVDGGQPVYYYMISVE